MAPKGRGYKKNHHRDRRVAGFAEVQRRNEAKSDDEESGSESSEEEVQVFVLCYSSLRP